MPAAPNPRGSAAFGALPPTSGDEPIVGRERFATVAIGGRQPLARCQQALTPALQRRSLLADGSASIR